MRKLPFLLATSLLAMALAPAAPAQQADPAVATSGVATDADAGTGVDTIAEPAADPREATDAPRSGFGQVMSVLTGLLQDAAQREATGRGDGIALDTPRSRSR